MRKIALVTGATAGIGFETARGLAVQGFHVLLHGRTLAKARAAAAEIPGGDGRVTPLYADLSDLNAVRLLAAGIVADYPRLDVLVNNAGVWNSKQELTAEGVEKTFAVNHLAPFLLTGLLREHLQPDGRIIGVSSDSHKQVRGIAFDDLNLDRNYHGLRSYAQSKLANVLFCYEYDRRKRDATTICAVQPGLVQTDIGLKGNTWLHRLAWRVRRQMSGHKTPVEGADTSVFLATTVDPPPSGLYWDDRQPKRSYSSSYDETEARKLWEESERLTNYTYRF
ncbi:NAD(P)-dependent dehydrogenase (short-subunit alcohol dehydrogenase family) [Lewinella aquimaris]|uniref:NAD(P)-dependent dehydrogenase (Short-subunit alcohol dehydrogenase family) n=1 Tax=Neolewinella aquimaris TaxID=1835722 RepID=A0A840E5R0_9BACT|nr:SDR family NAD(P)-dependent oxidoreductase [Neolewinella aquimaris]MBB4077458.1 NAD(P)-dependent dehydrogenase (short-subunit alcohol dehydrogenase family) [Neolewinella aquimaris]